MVSRHTRHHTLGVTVRGHISLAPAKGLATRTTVRAVWPSLWLQMPLHVSSRPLLLRRSALHLPLQRLDLLLFLEVRRAGRTCYSLLHPLHFLRPCRIGLHAGCAQEHSMKFSTLSSPSSSEERRLRSLSEDSSPSIKPRRKRAKTSGFTIHS